MFQSLDRATHRRAGGQSQHSASLERDAKSDRVQDALAFARRNLHEPLSVERLAEAARLSPRQFSRVFHAETGQSPAQAVENIRPETARLMLEQGRQPVEEVARNSGFGDRERMRGAFLRAWANAPGDPQRLTPARCVLNGRLIPSDLTPRSG